MLHKLAHWLTDHIRLERSPDRRFAVTGIGCEELALVPAEPGFGRRDPRSEIGHPRQKLRNLVAAAQRASDSIEDCTKDQGCPPVGLAPVLRLGSPLRLRNRLEHNLDHASREISARSQIGNAIQHDRAGALEDDLFGVAVMLARAEAGAGRERAQGVRQPMRDLRHVVEGEDMAVAGGDDQIVLVARRQADLGLVRIDEAAQQPAKCRFGAARLAVDREDRVGSARIEASDHPSDDQLEIGLVLHIDEIAQLLLDQAALFGQRQRAYVRRADKLDRRPIDDAPTMRRHLDSTPLRISEIHEHGAVTLT